MNTLLEEGQNAIEAGDWKEAAHFFEEADSLDKWRDVYGYKIYANLGKFNFSLTDF